jgi:hypothetical protein
MFASQGEHAAPRPLNREIARVPPLQLLQLVLAEEREKQGIPLLQLLRLRFGVFLWVGARHYICAGFYVRMNLHVELLATTVLIGFNQRWRPHLTLHGLTG